MSFGGDFARGRATPVASPHAAGRAPTRQSPRQKQAAAAASAYDFEASGDDDGDESDTSLFGPEARGQKRERKPSAKAADGAAAAGEAAHFAMSTLFLTAGSSERNKYSKEVHLTEFRTDEKVTLPAIAAAVIGGLERSGWVAGREYVLPETLTGGLTEENVLSILKCKRRTKAGKMKAGVSADLRTDEDLEHMLEEARPCELPLPLPKTKDLGGLLFHLSFASPPARSRQSKPDKSQSAAAAAADDEEDEEEEDEEAASVTVQVNLRQPVMYTKFGIERTIDMESGDESTAVVAKGHHRGFTLTADAASEGDEESGGYNTLVRQVLKVAKPLNADLWNLEGALFLFGSKSQNGKEIRGTSDLWDFINKHEAGTINPIYISLPADVSHATKKGLVNSAAPFRAGDDDEDEDDEGVVLSQQSAAREPNNRPPVMLTKEDRAKVAETQRLRGFEIGKVMHRLEFLLGPKQGSMKSYECDVLYAFLPALSCCCCVVLCVPCVRLLLPLPSTSCALEET